MEMKPKDGFIHTVNSGSVMFLYSIVIDSNSFSAIYVY